jgi:putative membrane protein insertion efficiency factor
MIILFLGNIAGFAQSADNNLINYEGLVENQSRVEHHHHFVSENEMGSNEIKLILYNLFKGYKLFISSQDQRSCTFTPSCSVYAIETIKKNGILKGFLDTMDRLTRCNGLSPELYEYDPDQKLFIDIP